MIEITDDLDGSKDAEEVSFSFRGTDDTIALGKKNLAAFEKALRPYLKAGTVTTWLSSIGGWLRDCGAERSEGCGDLGLHELVLPHPDQQRTTPEGFGVQLP
jgi:hypothetical protein